MQQQEIELAVVGSGELRLREKFKSLQVTPEKWSKMRVDQREKALEKVHSVAVDVSSASPVDNVTSFLGTSLDLIVKEIRNAGVDIVTSQSNPGKPHIVNRYKKPNAITAQALSQKRFTSTQWL